MGAEIYVCSANGEVGMTGDGGGGAIGTGNGADAGAIPKEDPVNGAPTLGGSCADGT